MVDTKAHSPETHPVSAAANAVEDSGAIMIKNPVGCLGAIALGMIVGILLLVATCSKLNERGSGDTNLVPSDAIYKAAAEKLVRRQLRDPESAIFSDMYVVGPRPDRSAVVCRSEEHTSELQSLMRISYAVFCLKNKNNTYK